MDFCWSDNLLFPYKYCKDTVITGSFLWCGHPNYLHSEEDLHLLRNNEVVLIGNKYFTRKNITQKLHFHPVGLFSKQKISSNVHKKTNAILISSGQTDTGKNFLEKQIIKNLRDIEILSSSSIIYLESDIFSRISFKSKNIREALFDQKMFKEIGSAVIRPGMGTISECWSNMVKIYPFFGENNSELENNSNIVKNIQGDKLEASNNLLFELKKAIYHNSSDASKEKHKKIINELSFNGIEQTARYLDDFFNRKAKLI